MGGLIYGLLNYTDNDQKALDFAVAASCLKHTIYGDYQPGNGFRGVKTDGRRCLRKGKQMKKFLDEDFLLENKTAEYLYHEHAVKMPIIDYHCHLSAARNCPE